MEPFDQAIQEHLELQRRNAALEATMPLDRYRVDDALDGHGLFKSESEARLEETSSAWPTREEEPGGYPPEDFWAATPAFDWGE